MLLREGTGGVLSQISIWLVIGELGRVHVHCRREPSCRVVRPGDATSSRRRGTAEVSRAVRIVITLAAALGRGVEHLVPLPILHLDVAQSCRLLLLVRQDELLVVAQVVLEVVGAVASYWCWNAIAT